MSDGTPPPPGQNPPEQNPYGAASGEPPPPAAPPGGQPVDPATQPGQVGGYPAAPPPPAMGPRPGELMDRFLARIIDGLLIFVVNLVVVIFVVVGVIMGAGSGLGQADSFVAGAVSAVLTTLIYLGYFAFLESSRGQTVGKMVLKLHVQGPDGGLPTLEQAIRRNIWAGFSILGIIPIVGGFIGAIASLVAVIMIAVGINNDPARRQAWHDKFAGGTQVIKQD